MKLLCPSVDSEDSENNERNENLDISERCERTEHAEKRNTKKRWNHNLVLNTSRGKIVYPQTSLRPIATWIDVKLIDFGVALEAALLQRL